MSMKRRGRPSDPYPKKEFVALLRREMIAGGISTLALGRKAGMPKGNLSGVLNSGRACKTEHRERLLTLLAAPPEVRERFLPVGAKPAKALVRMDTHSGSSHPILDQGQDHLIRGEYELAKRDFVSVHKSAERENNPTLEADAAMRMAWVFFEKGRVDACQDWIERSLAAIRKKFGATIPQIVDSVKPGSSSAVCSYGDEASHVLSRALHLRCKLLVENIVYMHKTALVPRAQEAFRLSLGLDEHLKDTQQLGHDYRWMAVLLSSPGLRKRTEAHNYLDKAGEMFLRGSLGDAYLSRDKGVIRYFGGEDFKTTRDHLLKGAYDLAAFSDARAMGPDLCVLSKLLEKQLRTDGLARRYSLAAAVLDPYSFVLKNAVTQYAYAHRPAETFLRDVDDLRHGKSPFGEIHGVMARLTENESRTPAERTDENIALVAGALSFI